MDDTVELKGWGFMCKHCHQVYFYYSSLEEHLRRCHAELYRETPDVSAHIL